MSISQAELRTRLSRVNESMQREELDALVVFSDGYRSGHGAYLTTYKPINFIEEPIFGLTATMLRESFDRTGTLDDHPPLIVLTQPAN